MLYRIADLITEVPATGGMASRCMDYAVPDGEGPTQIVIDDSLYRYDLWPTLDDNLSAYMESARQFYFRLLDFDGMMLHASATVIGGEAYLFAGQSGIGKSTHANLLRSLFPDARLINDDKPALRRTDAGWYAYGTPWSGKDGININAGVPLKAVTLLTPRRDRNAIRPAPPLAAVAGLLACSAGRTKREDLLKLTPLIDRLIKDIPVYEMDSLADEAAARMAYTTMKNGGTA